MQFLTPIYFSLSIFLIGVILFYLFRKQYEQQVISSTMLWHQVMREWQATKWWKKLQNHLLLYLQLLILILLMLALTRPYLGWNELSGEHIVVVLDTSATMTAMEEDSSRLNIAKEEIENLSKQLDQQTMTLILAEQAPNIVFSKESDKRKIQNELDSIEPSYQTTDMTKSIQLGNQLLSGSTGEIHVFSDQVKREQMDKSTLNQDLVVHNVGNTNQNLSILTFGVAENNHQVDGVLVLHNEQDTEQLVRILITSDGEELRSIQEVVGPKEEVQLSIEDLPMHSYYKAMISSSDAYQADNTSFAFLNPDTEPSLYLIGEVSPFLTKALNYFSSDIIQMEDSTNLPNTNHALYVLEKIPDTDWPNGPTLILNPEVSGPFQVEEKRLLENPITIHNDDSLMQFVDMEDVFIQSSYPYDASQLDTVIASNGTPIISRGYYDGNPIIFMGFDIRDTDWPLHPSFPVFLYNAIQFLTEEQEIVGFLKPLEQKEIAHSSSVQSSTIIDEEDEEVISLNTDQDYFQAPSIPGLYRIVEESKDQINERLFAVTIEPDEKYITPSESFRLNVESSSNEENEEQKDIPNEIWPWFVLLAFIILIIEWEVYRRGITN